MFALTFLGITGMKQTSVLLWCRQSQRKERGQQRASWEGSFRGCRPGQPALMFVWGPAMPSLSPCHIAQSPRGQLEKAVSALIFELSCSTPIPTSWSFTGPAHSSKSDLPDLLSNSVWSSKMCKLLKECRTQSGTVRLRHRPSRNRDPKFKNSNKTI